jgi:hypothetical protein
VHAELGLPAPIEYADIATIGTIADVAPLLGENRALVKQGLARLRASSWPGVRATLALARLSAAPTARDVAFGLAPRLNAAGRMGEAELGLELFTTGSESRAREIAARLDEHNRERKRITDAMLESALPMVDPGAPAIVLAHADWHPGVMGLVASQLVERFFRPVYIVAGGKGSVRSTPGISAVGGLDAAAAHLQRWGGHAQAAGFALDMDHFASFRDAICRYVAGHPPPQPAVVADALLGLEGVDADLFAAAVELEPYGEGHPPPGFLVGATVAAAKAVGHDGAHLQLRLTTADGRETKGVAFRQGALAQSLAVGDPVDVTAVLSENAWNGRTTIEFQALAVRPGERVGVGDQLRSFGGGRARVRRGPGDGRLVRVDPGAPDPFDGLRLALRAAAQVRLDMTAADLAALEEEANGWPTVTDVRAAWVARARGRATPIAPPTAPPTAPPIAPPSAGPLRARVDAILADLGLLDATGRVVKGRKVAPYTSPLLRTGLVRRYALLTLAEAYRRLDDDGFEHAVLALADLPPD